MQELLGGHPKRIRDNMGMSLARFRFIGSLLKEKCGLYKTRYMGRMQAQQLPSSWLSSEA
jgi:hypothetical protein